MKRRDFIALLGCAAAWPLAARAQPAAGKLPRIGFLQANQNENVSAFMQGLRDAGYIDGQNYYGTMLDRLAEIANELVALKCDVIFAAAPYAIQATLRATNAIPIVGLDFSSSVSVRRSPPWRLRPTYRRSACSRYSRGLAR